MPEELGQPIDGRRAWAAVTQHAPRHRRLFWQGCGLTLLLVAAFLCLPWPLKQLLGGSDQSAWLERLPAGVSAPIALGTLFFLLMAATGLFEYLQRVAFARFAIGWSRDLRAAADQAAKRLALAGDAGELELHRGDLVARLIGDVARFKASVKVTLVYVATNVVLLLAGCVLIASIHAPFGLVFGGTFALALAVAAVGARHSFRDFAGYRKKEGQLATSLSGSGAMEFDDLSDSARLEASEVRQQSAAAWLAHALVGAMVLAILMLGARSLEDGSLAAGDLLLFLGYALFLSKPLVRLTRHGARVGKLVAGGLRLGSYLAAADERSVDTRGRPQAGIRATLPSGAELELPLRGCVAFRGKGAGPWVRALAGADDGTVAVEWDRIAVTPELLRRHTKLVGHRPSWTSASLAGLVERLGAGPFAASLEGLGLVALAEARAGLAVAANEVSSSEAVGVALCLAAADEPPVFVLDRVRELLDEAGERALLAWIEAAARDALVVVHTLDDDWLPSDIELVELGSAHARPTP